MAVTLANQAAAMIFASPTGATGAPSFRALAATDVPSLDAAKITSGTFAVGLIPDLDAAKITTGTFATALIPDLDAAKITSGTFATARIPNLDTSILTSGTLGVNRGGTGVNGSSATDGQLLIGNGTGFSLANLTAGTGISVSNSAGGITITSTLAGGTVTNVGLSMPGIFAVTGSPVTGAGTMAVSLANQAAAMIFASPTGATGAPSFRALASTDIPSLDASKTTTGTFAVGLIPDLDAGKITSGTFATVRIPNLDTSILTSGTLGVNRGGTGVNASAAGSGQLLIGNGTGFSLANLTAGTGVTITNSAGSISIAASGTANAWAQGGNSFAQTGTLGTNDSNALLLKTNNTGRMYISSGGSIGIGTSSPSSLLDVQQSNASDLVFNLNNTNAGYGSYANISTSGSYAGLSLYTATQSWGLMMNGTTTLQIMDGTNSRVPLRIESGAPTNSLFVTSAGRIGLGTASPGAGIEFAGTGTNSSILIPRDSTANRPSGSLGMMRFNTSTSKFEVHDGASWSNILTGTVSAGTVTNIGLSMPGIFAVTGSPVTEAGTMAVTLANQSAAMVFASPTGTTGAPSFRALAAIDLPAHNTSLLTSGTLGTNRGGTGLDSSTASSGQLLIGNGSGFTLANLTAGTGITISNSAGSIAISAASSTNQWAQGGNSFGVSGTLGTNDANSLEIRTNSTPRIFISSTGTIGIGTSTPSSKVDVQGAGGIVMKAYTTDSGGTAWAGHYAGNANGVGAILQTYGTTGQAGTTSAHVFQVLTNNTVRATFSTIGNLGLGTITPQAGLDIATTGTLGSAIIVPRDTTGNRPTGVNGMIRYNTTTNKLETYQNSAWTDVVASSTTDWSQGGNSFGQTGTLGTNDANSLILRTNGTNRVSISSTGNVGIGTETPGSDLEISTWRNGAALNIIRSNDSTAKATVGMQNGSGTTPSTPQWNMGMADGEYNFSIMTWDSANLFSRLAITPTGSIGIGTSSPASMLDIRGNLRVESTESSVFRGGETYLEITPVTSSDSAGYIRLQGWDNYSSAGPRDISLQPFGGNVGIGILTPQAGLDIATTGTLGSAIIVPRDSTANRPSGVNGMIRYNTTTNKLETYQNSTWTDVISSSTTAWQQGGNSFGTTGTLGTNDSQNLTFKTNNSSRLTITSTGSIGLGTDSPGAGLDVQNGNLRVKNTSPEIVVTDSDSILNDVTQNGLITFRGSDSVLTGKIGFSGNKHLALINQNATGNITFATGAAEKMRLTELGNLYLGTTTNSVGSIFATSVNHVNPATGLNSVLLDSNISSTASSNTNSNIGLFVTPSIAPSNTQDFTSTLGFVGIRSAPTISAGASGTVHSAVGILSGINHQSNNTLNNALGIRIANPTVATGPIGSAAGLVIDAQSTATNNTYLLLGQLSIPGGSFGIYNASLNPNYFAGNVGIGTSAPQAGLDISTMGTLGSAIIVPRDTTGNRPNGVNGMIRYNTTTNKLETFQNSTWTDVVGSATTGWSQGGNSFGQTGTLGTNDANALVLRTSGTSRISILNTGKVGIGTTTPARTLDINGDMVVSGSLYADGGVNSNNSGFLFYNLPDTGLAVDGGTSNLFLKTNGTTRLSVTQGGSLGVGTDTPSDKFHVAGGNIGLDYGYGLNIRGGTVTYPTLISTGWNGSADYVSLHTAGNGAANNGAKMTLQSTGAISFGTSTPSSTYTFRHVANAGGIVVLGGDDPAAAVAAPFIGAVAATGFSTEAVYSFWYQNTGLTNPAAETIAIKTSNSERLRITPGGSVGINTSTPGAMLDVAGDARVTGNTMIVSENIQTSVNSGTAVTLGAMTSGTAYRVTLTGNATVTLPSDPGNSNGVAQITVVVSQDGTGSRTLAWAAPAGDSIAWSGGATPTVCTTASQKTIYQFMKINGDTTWYASQVWRQCP